MLRLLAYCLLLLSRLLLSYSCRRYDWATLLTLILMALLLNLGCCFCCCRDDGVLITVLCAVAALLSLLPTHLLLSPSNATLTCYRFAAALCADTQTHAYMRLQGN
jgi:hypothetical protein